MTGDRTLSQTELENYLSSRQRSSAWKGTQVAAKTQDRRKTATVPVDGNGVKRTMQVAGIERTGSCHLFRHSCATHMLENGADIRFIQQLLGHARLDTTQIYTEVTIHQLREVHARTHPHGRRAAAATVMPPGLPPAANPAS